MGAFLLYIIKSGLCLIIFYLFFRLLLRHTTFFRLNRITLLAGIMICMLLPFVELTTQETYILQIPLRTIQQALEDGADAVTTLSVETEVGEKTVVNSISWLPGILIFIYCLGACITFFLLLGSTFRIYQLIKNAEIRKEQNYLLAIVQQPIGSFSWGKYIVMSEVDYRYYSEEILLHEIMHLRNLHTLDLLFIQLLLVFHWCNPVVWLLKRDLQEIHEYEADKDVINTGIDATKYQLLLVKKAAGTRLYSMANGFNHSKLKNRITMMLKKKTNPWARLKLLLFVPVVAGTLYAFAQPELNETLEQAVDGEQQLTADEDYLSLINFFEKERNISSKYSRTACEGRMSTLFVNTRNRVIFNQKHVNSKDLKVVLVEDLRNAWLKSGKKEIQSIVYSAERGVDISELVKPLKAIKGAYIEMREEIARESTDKSKEYLDKVFPIFVSEYYPETKYSSESADNDVISEIAVTLYDNSGVIQSLKNFTLKELEDKVVAVRKTIKELNTFVVGLKVDKACSAVTLYNVKKVLRDTSALKVNYENSEKLKM